MFETSRYTRETSKSNVTFARVTTRTSSLPNIVSVKKAIEKLSPKKGRTGSPTDSEKKALYQSKV